MELETLDAFLRHQVYVEGYKNGQITSADSYINEIAVLVLLELTRRGYTSFGDMPKRELNAALSAINNKLTDKASKLVTSLMEALRQFATVDFGISNAIFKAIGSDTYKGIRGNKLWNEIKNQIVPGAGLTTQQILTTLLGSFKNEVNKVIKMAFVDNVPLSELAAKLTGTRANNFKDGIINKLRNQFSSAIQTLIQNISTYIMYKIGSYLYDRYQWVSVLDSRTTDICRGRNGNVYEYGKGPRPPAHYNCRSTIIPVAASVGNDLPSYVGWLKTQPVSVQDDILGKRRGVGLRKGDITDENLPKFDGVDALTLSQYKDKRKLITM